MMTVREVFMTMALASCALPVRADSNTYQGAASGDWDAPANWSLGRVPTAEDDVIVAKAVVKSGTSALVAASLTLNNGAALTVGADNTCDRWPSLDITGDLTLNGNAKLTIYPGPTNETHTFKTGGARVTVGGTTTLNGTSSIIPYSHRTTASATSATPATGAPVVFDLHGFVLSAGTSVNAANVGFTRDAITPMSYAALGLNAGQYWAGSHGGVGGTVSGQSPKRMLPYDNPLAPIYPGTSGGNGGYSKGQGGGVIRISATTAEINGTLDVSGQAGSWSGAGAGGSIWLTAESVSVGATALFKAKGGKVQEPGYGSEGGAGAGGRIAIGIGLTTTQIDELYTTGTAAGLATNDLAAVFPGAVNVDPGDIRVAGEWPQCWGGVGSAVYVYNVGSKHGFLVENDADVSPVQSPARGIAAYAADETVTATATSPALMRGSTSVRRVCTGWEIRDAATGEVLASGETAAVSDYTMPAKDVKLVWKWGTVENGLSVGTIGNGTVSTAGGWVVAGGTYASVTATAGSEDDEFQYWTGDVEPEKRSMNPLTLSAERPRSVKAFFGKKVGATYAMKNSNNNTVYNWHDSANWSPTGIPGTNDTAQVLRTGGGYKLVQVDSFARVKSFTVSDTAGANANVRVGCTATNTSRDMPAHTEIDKQALVGFEVLDDLTVAAGGWLAVGGLDQEYPVLLKVGGNLTVAGKLGVTAASTNHVSASLYDATTVVEVGNKLTVESTGVVTPNIHYKTGASVVFRAKTIEVAAGGAFNANGLGYCQYSENGSFVFPWPTRYDTRCNKYEGGAHGGRGGKISNKQAPAYGLANAPIYAGMPGGNSGSRSAGVIRLEAAAVKVDGSLMAHGYDSGSNGNGSGAGGTVAVYASESFASSLTTVIDVGGGVCERKDVGGGGGGRAVVGVRLTDEQKAALLTTDDVEGVKVSQLASVVPGFTKAGGSNGGYATSAAGEDGTGLYFLNMAGKSALIVVGEPSNLGDVTPSYGQGTYAAGAKIDFSASASVLVSGSDGKSRRLCSGYVVSNETQGVFASGTGTSGSFDMPKEDTYLFWSWTNLQHRLSVAAQGGGSVTTNVIGAAESEWQTAGSNLRLTAVPDEGKVFVGWLGWADIADRTAAAIDLSVDAPCALTAVFASATGETKSWAGGTDGEWTSPASWSPEGMPGPYDTVVFPGSATTKVRVNAGFPAPVGTMTVPYNIYIICGNGSESAGDFVGLKVTGDLIHKGRMQVGRQGRVATPVVEVGGNLTLTGDYGWNFITLTAAPRQNPESSEMYRLGGGRLSVGGTLRLKSGAWVRPICESRSGAPIIVTSREFVLEAGAQVNATGDTYCQRENLDGLGTQGNAGYRYSLSGSERVGYAPGSPTAQFDFYHGASYGGLGCRDLQSSGSVLCTSTYGIDFAPYMPGSNGGNNAPGSGGAIRIACRKATIAGKLEANGITGSATGGSSGGSIWLTCRKLDLADTAEFSVQGGAPCDWGAKDGVARSGGGGGGRICITVGASDEDVAAMYSMTSLPQRLVKYDLTDVAVCTQLGIFCATNSVKGGHKEKFPNNDGGDGTAVLVKALRGLTVIVR